VSLFNIALSSRFYCKRSKTVATSILRLTPFLALKFLSAWANLALDSKARYGVSLPLHRNNFRDAEANAMLVFAKIRCIRRTLCRKNKRIKLS
jgi:hypothetical protein